MYPVSRTKICKCGREYTKIRLHRKLGLQGQVMIRNLEVYVCGAVKSGTITSGCGDAWSVNLDAEDVA